MDNAKLKLSPGHEYLMGSMITYCYLLEDQDLHNLSGNSEGSCNPQQFASDAPHLFNSSQFQKILFELEKANYLQQAAGSINYFVTEDGLNTYKEHIAAHKAESEQVKYKNALEVSNLELAIRAAQEAELNAEKSEERAVSARNAAWASTIIAGLVLLFELYKYFSLKK